MPSVSYTAAPVANSQNSDLLTHEDQVACLLLWRCKGIGPATFRKVLKCVEAPRDLLSESIVSDSRIPDMFKDRIRGANRSRLLADVDKDLRWAENESCGIIYQSDFLYPYSLKQFSEAPPLLFYKGSPSVLNQPQVSIVGTRKPSHFGAKTAHQLAQQLVGLGLTVTSGLAVGIDGQAHKGALKGGGQTIAVLAHGLDRLYPSAHKALSESIVVEHGALISEFPIGVAPQRQYFPRRNRIMSAISYGVVVVEAAIKSGTLITARLAAHQGKEVFAVPGQINNPMTKGCHQLIKEGAHLVEGVEDILCVLQPLLQQQLSTPDAVALQVCGEGVGCVPDNDRDLVFVEKEACYNRFTELPKGLSEAEEVILSKMGAEPKSIEQLISVTGYNASQLLMQLMQLELRSLIETLPDGYQRIY